MKSYFVEITVGIFMDEMDDENSPETVAEIADRLTHEAISNHWNSEIVTTVNKAEEVDPRLSGDEVLSLYADH